MKLLVIGSGGREHAIAWKLAQNKKVVKVYVAPGNPGINREAKCESVNISSINGLVHFAKKQNIQLTIVGPELYLAKGIVDIFKKNKLPIFGPHKKAALLETSKIYAKKFMTKYHIPTATYKVFTNFTQTKTYLIKAHYPLVIKADGLAAGKGVVIVNNFNQANKCIEAFMQTDIFHNQAGKKVVIESYLTGYEASIICLVDHHQILPMVSAKDHKQAYDHDLGPNTGGMGVIAPNPYLTKKDLALFHQKILLPTLKGLKQEKINYQGFIFFGVMLTPDGPKLLEYNTRMGDPETQAILPLMESDFYEVINWCMLDKLKFHQVNWSKQVAINVMLVAEGYPDSYSKGMKINVNRVVNKIFYSGVSGNSDNLMAAGGRILSITAIAKNKILARNKVYADIKKVNISHSRYRRDIGI